MEALLLFVNICVEILHWVYRTRLQEVVEDGSICVEQLVHVL